MILASPWKRLLAHIIDNIISWTLGGIALVSAASVFSGVAALCSQYVIGYYGYAGYRIFVGTGLSIIVFILSVSYLAAECILYAKAQSIGKAIVGLRVVKRTGGEPFTFGRMLLREIIVKPVCGSCLYLGYIWILIDEEKRGWADMILDSYVIDERLSCNSGRAEDIGVPKHRENVKKYIRDNDPSEVQSRYNAGDSFH